MFELLNLTPLKSGFLLKERFIKTMSKNYDQILSDYFSQKNKKPIDHAKEIWDYAGFRRAGTEGDKKASEIISKKFEDVGTDEVFVDKFLGKNKAPPISLILLFIIFSFSAIVYIISAYHSIHENYNPIIEFLLNLLALGIFAFSVIYIVLDRKKAKDILGFLTKDKEMYNIIGKVKPSNETKKIVIVSGHHDAPWNGKLFEKKDKDGNPGFFKTYVLFNDGTEKVLIGCAITILVYQVFSLFNIFINFTESSIWFNYFRLAFVILILVVWFWLGTFVYYIMPRGVSPGANDNLASICVIITLLGILAKKKPKNVEVWGLSLTGEETNHMGVKNFIKTHYDEIKDAYDINMEAVGGSSILPQVFFAADGEKPKKATFPKELIELVLEGMKKSGVKNISPITETLPIGGSDAAIFANKGLKAILIGAVGVDKSFAGNYHNPDDTVENLDENIMEGTIKILLSTIDILDSNL
jgi:hypothetical protein